MALAIAGIGLGALVAAVSQGLGNVTAANLYIEAARRAQTHLDAVGLAGPVAPGEDSGDDGGGFSWRIKVAPVGVRLPPKGSDKQGLTLYDLTVTITWRSGAGVKSLSVQSERLGRIGKS